MSEGLGRCGHTRQDRAVGAREAFRAILNSLSVAAFFIAQHGKRQATLTVAQLTLGPKSWHMPLTQNSQVTAVR